MNSFITWFKDIRLEDIHMVGGKNASLGEMFGSMAQLGIKVPNGFAITVAGYRHFLSTAGIDKKIISKLEALDSKDISRLKRTGAEIRALILNANLPTDLAADISTAYRELCNDRNNEVAVRSSATAEDLPDASFAGQQETYLNIKGEQELKRAVLKCFASLFTDRAISYRGGRGIDHVDVALSVGVQKMVRADLASSGVMFTADTETGFDKVVSIESAYGLGETVVQGKVSPDEFMVFKSNLHDGQTPIIHKVIGDKSVKLVYSHKGTAEKSVGMKDQQKFSLTDSEVVELAQKAVAIESYYSKKYGRYQPMDIEWAKDGLTGDFYILQARPETTLIRKNQNTREEYILDKEGKVLVTGVAVGTRIGSGKVRIIKNASQISSFKAGEVLVSESTNPDWEPIMKKAAAIITDKGGRTSHAAIVSRELGVPCVVGAKDATKKLKNGQSVTVDCSSGGEALVYSGALPFKIIKLNVGSLPVNRTKVMLNIGSPEEAFKNSFLPVDGVGLGRLEFIINSAIKIHPNALINFVQLKKNKEALIKRIVKEVELLTFAYQDKGAYYVDNLAIGIGKIAAAFWPNDVIVRFSDFKSNEYRKLIGGALYEPREENPMLGWRGASRYYHPDFIEAFKLECLAIKKAREEMGFKNIVPMVPFCRTPEEGEMVLKIMRESGLDRVTDKSLKVYMMCEIPSNVILADKFLDIFDGMSIGSNDLTQLIVGIDRDAHALAGIANETNEAVKLAISEVIKKCRARNKYIGICGQAPSDHPDFAKFLVQEGISSISLNPDAVIKTIINIAEYEKSK